MTLTEPDASAALHGRCVTLTIDDVELSVPKGTLVIRAAELIGIQIPRFCDHPLLEPVGACRQCLVEVEGQRKPMASCTTAATDDMVVRTQFTSPVGREGAEGRDGAAADQPSAGLPDLRQGRRMPTAEPGHVQRAGRISVRGRQTHFPETDPISSQVLLDRERCVLCARCTRFSNQIAGDPFIETDGTRCAAASRHLRRIFATPFAPSRSNRTSRATPCRSARWVRSPAPPTGSARARSIWCPARACASTARAGCAQRTDHRRGKVLRRLAGDDPQVNEEWNCDKGRWAFTYATQPDRITSPLIRDADGSLVPASWSQALAVAAARAERRRTATSVCWSAAEQRSRTPTRMRSSRESRWAATTSTSAPGHIPPRRPISWPPESPGGR